MMRKVDEFMSTADDYEGSWLQKIFEVSVGGFFGNLWIPCKEYDPNTDKLAEDYTYYNVGMSPSQLADLYWTEYSGCYLIGGKTIQEDYNKLVIRCTSIFQKNKPKYKKLTELMCYEWNPLWNVDGYEIRQLLENSGTTDINTGEIRSNLGVQYDNMNRSHNVSAYDSATKKEYEDVESGNGAVVPTGIQRVEEISGEVTVTSTQVAQSGISHADNYTNGLKGSTTYVHNLAKNISEGNEVDYVVDARDTAFGQALKGADKMHVEKLIRQGNIGVISTVKLLQEAQDYLRFNILDEFFKDINKVILIGTYDQ